jgi:hypothetical protein
MTTSPDPHHEPDPYVRFVEKVIDALEELIHEERNPALRHPSVVHDFRRDLDDTLQQILNYKPESES